ncbi:hypothetical protein FOZ63_021069, partial [Perkinsus olseni]
EFFFTKAFLDMNRNGPVIVREEKDSSRRPIDQNGERYRREREDTEMIRSTGGRPVEARGEVIEASGVRGLAQCEGLLIPHSTGLARLLTSRDLTRCWKSVEREPSL